MTAITAISTKAGKLLSHASSILGNMTSANHKRKDKNISDEEKQLRAALEETRQKIEIAESCFNELTDSAAVDYTSYEVLAAKARYSYLIKLAKEKNLHIK